MPYVRKIRKARWHSVTCLQIRDLQADVLADLNTQDNALSVWYVEENEANLKRIAAALAAECNTISNVDYVTFAEEDVARLNIKAIGKPGMTPDRTANAWHLDFAELAAQRLVELAYLLQVRGKRGRISEKDVLKLLASGLMTQQIDRTKVKLRPEELAKVELEIRRLNSSIS